MSISWNGGTEGIPSLLTTTYPASWASTPPPLTAVFLMDDGLVEPCPKRAKMLKNRLDLWNEAGVASAPNW
jgi:hypothetical protein